MVEKNGKRLPAKDDQFTITSQVQTKEGWLVHPSPEACDIAQGGHCKPYGRLNVRIEGDSEDELGTFIFRTTGYNSIRTLAARLNYYHAVSGGLLACMPLELRLRGKSTTQSFRSAIYYVDMVVRDGLTIEEAIAQAQALHQQRVEAGYDQTALDEAARLGFSNGAFEDSNEESAEVMEEFYPETQTQSTSNESLLEKLDQRASA